MTSPKPSPVGRFRPADLERDWSTLRTSCPVSRTTSPDGAEAWLVTKYRDIRSVLSSPVFQVSPIDPQQPDSTGESNESIFQDPPQHTRLRGMVAVPFAAGQVGRHRDAIRARADELIRPILSATEPIDIVEQFAKPLTMNVIAEVVGVPAPDREMFQRLSDQMLVPLSEAQGTIALEGWRQLNDYVRTLIAQRRAAPVDKDTDLLAHLIHAQERDPGLTDAELTTMVLGLPVAGYVSTTNAIAVAVRYLVEGKWLDELRGSADAETLTERFVDEVLRMQSGDNGESMPRFAAQDVQLGDALIRQGDMVVAPLVAANRDDEFFDRPNDFDPRRAGPNRHVAFGVGIHRCLGANLAQLELIVAVEALVESGVRFEMPESWDLIPWSVNMFGDRFPVRLLVSASAGR